jgi:hypothetical protein
MKDARAAALARAQFIRISLTQLRESGFSRKAIRHRLNAGRLVTVGPGVFAIAPVCDDDEWVRWMAATLTQPHTFLSHLSAAAAWGLWSLPRPGEAVTRPGKRGRSRRRGLVVHYSTRLAGETTEQRGIPITTVPRTLLDVAGRVSDRALARCVREAAREGLTDVESLIRYLISHGGRRGAARLRVVLTRYSGLPLERARSGAEVRALELLRNHGHPPPALNVRRAGEEADLSWARRRLIIEIDGGPFTSIVVRTSASSGSGRAPAGACGESMPIGSTHGRDSC